MAGKVGSVFFGHGQNSGLGRGPLGNWIGGEEGFEGRGTVGLG